MECPDCGYENIAGSEYCEGCSADLVGSQRIAAITEFDLHLTTDLVDALAPKPPAIVKPTDSCADAISLMKQRNIGCLLVSTDGASVQGIFTEDDVMRKLSGESRRFVDIPVREIMTADPVVLRHDDTVAVAINKMVLGKFRHIPVVSADGKLDGVFSARDILKHVHELLLAE